MFHKETNTTQHVHFSEEHITPVLQSLHWLPVTKRIEYKILCFTYRSVQKTASQYLQELVCQYNPPRSLRSSSLYRLSVSGFGENTNKTTTTTTTKRSAAKSFRSAASTLRNRLPDKFYQVKDMASFWRQLKSHLFSTMWSPHPPALIPSPLSSSYCQTFQFSESCAVSMWFSWMESDLALKVDRHWHLAFLHSRSQDNEVELYFSVLIVSTL